MHIPFAQLLADYGYWALFVGSLLEGETMLALAGLAAHQGYLSLPWSIAVAFVGGTLGDQLFFWWGRLGGRRLLERYPKTAPRVRRMQDLLDRHNTPIIVGIRFMYGLRILGPIVIGTCHVSAWRFALLNALGAAIWAPLVVGLGYLFGNVLDWVLNELKDVEMVVLAIAIVAALVIGGLRWHKRRDRMRSERLPPD